MPKASQLVRDASRSTPAGSGEEVPERRPGGRAAAVGEGQGGERGEGTPFLHGFPQHSSLPVRRARAGPGTQGELTGGVPGANWAAPVLWEEGEGGKASWRT